jgi:aminopeptidase N
MQSPRALLSEGVAHFMGTLWVEKQHGREQALGALEAGRAALALAEPESPGQSAGQPLAAAISPVYYRTKAGYVLWMLRDVAGDQALSAALRAYDPAQDLGKDAGRCSFEKLLEQAGLRRDLSWFFADWVDADKGLPDLSVEGAFPNAVQSGNWLVAVNLANNGYAAAEVPVTVRSATNSVVQRVLIPARGKAVVRLLVQGKPTEVQVNDGTIPETQASIHITNLDDAPPAPSSAPIQAIKPKR